MPFITDEVLAMLEQLSAADAGAASSEERLLPQAWKTVFQEMVTDSNTTVPEVLEYDFAFRLLASLSQINLSDLIKDVSESMQVQNENLLNIIISKIAQHDTLKQNALNLRPPVVSLADHAIPIIKCDEIYFEDDDDDDLDDEPSLSLEKKQLERQLFSKDSKVRMIGMELLSSLYERPDDNFRTYAVEVLTAIVSDNVELTYEFFRFNLIQYPFNQTLAKLIMELNTALYTTWDISDEPEYYEKAMCFLANHTAKNVTGDLLKTFQEYCERNKDKENFHFRIEFQAQLAEKSHAEQPSAKKIKREHKQDKVTTQKSSLFLWPNVVVAANTQVKSLPEQRLDYWLSVNDEQRRSYFPMSVAQDFVRYEKEQNRLNKSIDAIKAELRQASRYIKLNDKSTLDDYIKEANEDDEDGCHLFLSLRKQLLTFLATPDAENHYKQHSSIPNPRKRNN